MSKPSCPGEIAVHGGDVYHLARALKLAVSDLLDFSANINPLGYPPGLSQALSNVLPQIIHYPDRTCWELRQDLAAYHGLPPEAILVGNGSTELIYLAARQLQAQKALVVIPAFSEYESSLKAAGTEIIFHATRAEAQFGLEGTPELHGAGLVFLANPASPSGMLLPPEQLLHIAQDITAAGAYLMLDEAFIDFVEEASLKSFLDRLPRLLILRSFTKFFGIPGVRLGYLLAAPPLIARLAAGQEPWSVSTLAQAVGRACLADRDFMARTQALVAAEGNYLFHQLVAIPELAPLPSAVNYLLVKIARPHLSAAALRTALLGHRIIIRDASNFRGLDNSYFRVAVQRREDNNRLLAALLRSLTEL